MPVLASQLDTRADAYRQNRAHMLESLGQLDTLYAQAAAGGGPAATQRLRERG